MVNQFVQKSLDKLQCPPDKKQIYYKDEKTSNLWLQVARGGTKSFVYRRWDGIRKTYRQEFLGGYPELKIEQARKKATEMNHHFGEGRNPIDEALAVKSEPIFRDLFNAYIERHMQKKRKTSEVTKRDFERWLAALAIRKPSTITHLECERLHGKIAQDKGQYAANRAIQLGRAVFNKAKTFKLYQGENPFEGITLYREHPRDRFLSDEEAARLMNALESTDVSLDLRDFIRLDMYTGVRKGNLLTMRWDEIVGLEKASKEGTWFIPAEKSKNGKPMAIPLGMNELSVLRDRQKRSPFGEWVFPSKTSKSGHLIDLKKSWTALRKAAALEDIRIHDLRRSVAAAMTRLDISTATIKRALHHEDVQTTLRHYAMTADTEALRARKQVQDKWHNEAKRQRNNVAKLERNAK